MIRVMAERGASNDFPGSPPSVCFRHIVRLPRASLPLLRLCVCLPRGAASSGGGGLGGNDSGSPPGRLFARRVRFSPGLR